VVTKKREVSSLVVVNARRIYWTNVGVGAVSIQSSRLTGAERKVIVGGHGNVVRPVGLCVDVDRRRLYWYDDGFGTISTSAYDGSDLKHFRVPPSYVGRVVGLSVGRVSVKLHLRDGRTDGRTDEETSLPSFRSFVCFFCPLCLSGTCILYGENKPRCFIEIWGEGGDKIRDQPINTQHWVS